MEESGSPCLQIGTSGITSISRKARNSTKHPGCCQCSCGGHPLALPAHTGDVVEVGFWDQTLATCRGGFGHFCSPLKSPDQPWPFPAAKAEMEKLKLGRGRQGGESSGRVQNPDGDPQQPGASPGPSRQPYRELPVRERPGPGLGTFQPPWRHHKQ